MCEIASRTRCRENGFSQPFMLMLNAPRPARAPRSGSPRTSDVRRQTCDVCDLTSDTSQGSISRLKGARLHTVHRVHYGSSITLWTKSNCVGFRLRFKVKRVSKSFSSDGQRGAVLGLSDWPNLCTFCCAACFHLLCSLPSRHARRETAAPHMDGTCSRLTCSRTAHSRSRWARRSAAWSPWAPRASRFSSSAAGSMSLAAATSLVARRSRWSSPAASEWCTRSAVVLRLPSRALAAAAPSAARRVESR